MDLSKLSYFHSAALYSNFTKAAKACHIAQTAMSRHIADIEKELGVELFQRVQRKVTLTPAGELFFQETKDLMKKYNEIVHSVQNVASGYDENLIIAFGFYDRPLLLEYTSYFQEKHPNISITIQQYPHDVLIHELVSGKCDVIFCPPLWASALNNVRAVRLRPCTNHIAFNKAHPFAQCEKLTPEHIDGQTIITPASDKFVEALELLCAHLKIKPKKLVAANTLEAMISMVELNVGIALVPSFVSENYWNIRFLPFDYTLRSDKRHAAICLKPAPKHSATLFLAELALHTEMELE